MFPLSIGSSVRWSICPFVHLSISLSNHRSICPSAHLSIGPVVHHAFIKNGKNVVSKFKKSLIVKFQKKYNHLTSPGRIVVPQGYLFGSAPEGADNLSFHAGYFSPLLRVRSSGVSGSGLKWPKMAKKHRKLPFIK